MLAAVYHGLGDVRVQHVPEPPPPAADEVCLRVARAAICGTDASEFKHGPHIIPLLEPHPGSRHQGPLVLGHEFTGLIEDAGSDVVDLRPGDRVASGAGMWCGTCAWCLAGRTNICSHYYTLGLQAHGGLAEYVNVPARMCRSLPDACSDDAAAIAQPCAVALHAMRRGSIQHGRSLAVIGVGGIGFFLLAAAVAAGVEPILALDIHSDRLARARSLGTIHTLDATQPDVRLAVREITGAIGVDVVVEASGAPPAPTLAQSLVKRGGTVVMLGLQAEPRALDLADLVVREVDIVSTNAHVCDQDLPEAIELLADGRIAAAAIDRVVPLEDVVAEGLVPLAEGRVSGKVVVDPSAKVPS